MVLEIAIANADYGRSSNRSSSRALVAAWLPVVVVQDSRYRKGSFSREVFPGRIPPCPLVGRPLGALKGTPYGWPTSQSSPPMLFLRKYFSWCFCMWFFIWQNSPWVHWRGHPIDGLHHSLQHQCCFFFHEDLGAFCRRQPRTYLSKHVFLCFVPLSQYFIQDYQGRPLGSLLNGWNKQLAPIPPMAVIWLRMWSLDQKTASHIRVTRYRSSDILGRNLRIDSVLVRGWNTHT